MSSLAVQLEHPGERGFIELSTESLGGYAEALARAWEAVGVRQGDRVVIYDHGSSPMAYLASRAFTPYLGAGAAERTMASALCVDGLPDNVGRFGHVLRHFRPAFAFVREELLNLLIAGPTAVPVELREARLVVSADGDVPGGQERRSWQAAWPGGVSVLARCDAAAFVAAECPDCGLLHIPADLYEARLAPGGGRRRGCGRLLVRARFMELGSCETELAAAPHAPGGRCAQAGFELI